MQTQGLGLQMMVLAQGHSAWDILAYFSKVEENRYVTPLFFYKSIHIWFELECAMLLVSFASSYF